LLGQTLSPHLESNGHHVYVHGRNSATEYHADISNAADASNLLNTVKPTVIINLIGLTDVDRCEAQPNQAYLINVRTVENITDWIKQEKAFCHLVHMSTDQVYDGNGLHHEKQVALKNYYAFSKYAGELAAANVPSTILRTNFFGKSHCAKRASLTDWLFRVLSNNEPASVFTDVMFSPLSMGTLSKMIDLTSREKPIGVFNLGSWDGLSKADFAFAFAEEIRLPPQNMVRATIDDAEFIKTYRPKDMRMDCSRFERTLGVKLPRLIDEIKQAAKEYREIA